MSFQEVLAGLPTLELGTEELSQNGCTLGATQASGRQKITLVQEQLKRQRQLLRCKMITVPMKAAQARSQLLLAGQFACPKYRRGSCDFYHSCPFRHQVLLLPIEGHQTGGS